MAELEGTPDPSRTFMQGMVDVSDYLLHHFGHGVQLIGKMEANQLFSVGEICLHFKAAGDAAARGDWEKVAEHFGSMGNSGANFLTGGILGVIEGTVDAAVLLHHMQGHNAITFDEAMNQGLKLMGEHIGDKVADAREVAQLWIDKTFHGDDNAPHAISSHQVLHTYENFNVYQALSGVRVDPNRNPDQKGREEQHVRHQVHSNHSGHHAGMSVPDHLANPSGHATDAMNITLQDENHHRSHGTANADTTVHHGSHGNHSGMSVPDHLANPSGHATDANTPNANLPDKTHPSPAHGHHDGLGIHGDGHS